MTRSGVTQRTLAAVFFAVVVLCGTGGKAATLTWTGATSTDWGTASNWSPAQVPTVADHVIIPALMNGNDPHIDGGVNLSVGTDQELYRCASMTILSGGKLSLGNGGINTYIKVHSDITVNSGGVLENLDQGYFRTYSGGTLTVNGSLQDTGSSANWTIYEGGTWIINSGGHVDSIRSLSVFGTLNVNAGSSANNSSEYLNIYGGLVNIEDTAVWTIENNCRLGYNDLWNNSRMVIQRGGILSTLDDVRIYGSSGGNPSQIEVNGTWLHGNSSSDDLRNRGGIIAVGSWGRIESAGDLLVGTDTSPAYVEALLTIDSGGTVTVANDTRIGPLGTMTSAGTFTSTATASDRFIVENGILNVHGGVFRIGAAGAESSSDLNVVDGGTVNFHGGTVYIADQLDVVGGTINMSSINGGSQVHVCVTEDINGGSSSAKLRLDADSTLTMGGGHFHIGGAWGFGINTPAIQFAAGATITGTSTDFSCYDADPTALEGFYLDLQGATIKSLTITKSDTEWGGNPQDTQDLVELMSDATIGTLTVNDGVIRPGAYTLTVEDAMTLPENGEIDVHNGGSFIASQGATINSGGILRVTHADAIFSVDSPTLTSSAVDKDLVVNGTIQISDGTIHIPNELAVEAGGTLAQTGGTIKAGKNAPSSGGTGGLYVNSGATVNATGGSIQLGRDLCVKEGVNGSWTGSTLEMVNHFQGATQTSPSGDVSIVFSGTMGNLTIDKGSDACYIEEDCTVGDTLTVSSGELLLAPSNGVSSTLTLSSPSNATHTIAEGAALFLSAPLYGDGDVELQIGTGHTLSIGGRVRALANGGNQAKISLGDNALIDIIGALSVMGRIWDVSAGDYAAVKAAAGATTGYQINVSSNALAVFQNAKITGLKDTPYGLKVFNDGDLFCNGVTQWERMNNASGGVTWDMGLANPDYAFHAVEFENSQGYSIKVGINPIRIVGKSGMAGWGKHQAWNPSAAQWISGMFKRTTGNATYFDTLYEAAEDPGTLSNSVIQAQGLIPQNFGIDFLEMAGSSWTGTSYMPDKPLDVILENFHFRYVDVHGGSDLTGGGSRRGTLVNCIFEYKSAIPAIRSPQEKALANVTLVNCTVVRSSPIPLTEIDAENVSARSCLYEDSAGNTWFTNSPHYNQVFDGWQHAYAGQYFGNLVLSDFTLASNITAAGGNIGEGGRPATDIMGVPRSNPVDPGAHEFDATASTNPCAPVFDPAFNACIEINWGATHTASTNVTLTTWASANSNLLVAFKESPGGAWTPYENYSTTPRPWTLTGGDGTKAVYMRFSNDESVLYKTTITLDTAPPTMTIEAAEGPNGFASSHGTLSLTFTSSETTGNFVEGDTTVSNGLISGFSGSGTTYTATFTPTESGLCTIKVAGNRFTDTAGNNNTISDLFSWTYDGPALTPMITSISASPGGGLTIEWNDVGLNYTVQETSDLLFPAWSPAAGSWPVATNAWSGAASTSNGATFYRVVGQE